MLKRAFQLRSNSDANAAAKQQQANAAGPTKLKTLWAEKGSSASSSAAPPSTVDGEGNLGNNAGPRIWGDEEMKDVLAAFLEWCPQPATELRRIDLKMIAWALGAGEAVPIEQAAGFVNMLCRYLIRAISAPGDSNVIKSLCDDFGVIGNNCRIIVIMILSLDGLENLKPIGQAGVPSALVRLVVRMHSMVILVESERQKEKVDLRQIHLVLWYIVSRLLRHLSHLPETIEDLIQGDGIGRLTLLASQAAKGVCTTGALFTAASVSKWIELHSIDILLFLLESDISPQLAQHMVRNSTFECVGDALEHALEQAAHSPSPDGDEFHLYGVLALFKVLLRVAQGACAAGSVELLEHARACNPLLLLKGLILRLCGELYKDAWPNKEGAETDLTPLGEGNPGAAGFTTTSSSAWNVATVLEIIREARRRKSYRFMYLVDDEVQRETAYRLLHAKSWDVDEAVEAYFRTKREQDTEGKAEGRKVRDRAKKVEYGGVGIKLGVDQGVFYVLKVAPGESAHKSGNVQELDEIIAVGDEQITSTMTLRDVVSLIRGPCGEEVSVTFRSRTSAAAGQLKTVRLTRSKPEPPKPIPPAVTEGAAPADGAPAADVPPATAAPDANVGGARELVDRLNGDLPIDIAEKLVAKAGGDVDRAEMLLQMLPKTRVLNDLLVVAKELTFVGEAPIEVDPKAVQGLVWSKSPEGIEYLSREVTWSYLAKAPGRRARDSQAFLVLCELWHRVYDDSFREQILDLALEVFTEHPLNFFVLQSSGFLSAVLECQDALSPTLRERTMKVLEYVMTCADCVPERDLVLVTRCLDTVWEEETVQIALRTVVKWLNFDAKYAAVFRETGLLLVLVRHLARFSKQISGTLPSAQSANVRAIQDSEGEGPWLAYDKSCMKLVPGHGIHITAACGVGMSMALGVRELVGGNWSWQVTITREGRAKRGPLWCGVGVASRESELRESHNSKQERGKSIRGWFYHDKGFLGNGEMLNEEGVPPFWFTEDEKCVIGVELDGRRGELSFTCNGQSVRARMGGVAGAGLHPAVYGGCEGITFVIDGPHKVPAPPRRQISAPEAEVIVVPGPQRISIRELQKRYIHESLQREGVLDEDNPDDLSYTLFYSSVVRLVDFALVRPELNGMTEDEKRVICDRIWAAASQTPNADVTSSKGLEYCWVPMSYTVTEKGLVNLLIRATHGDVSGLLVKTGHNRDDEIGEVAADVLLEYASAMCLLLATPGAESLAVIPSSSKAGGGPTNNNTRCLVSARNFEAVMDSVLLMVSQNYNNMRAARSGGLRDAALDFLRVPAYREPAIRLMQCMVAEDALLNADDLLELMRVLQACGAQDIALRRGIIDCVDKVRSLNDYVAPYLAQSGWLHAIVDVIGQLNMPDPQTTLVRSGSNLKSSRAGASNSASAAGQWLIIGLVMACMRLLCLTTVSPLSLRSALWDVVGWRTFVKRAEEGGFMRLGGGYTVLGLLLDLAVDRPNGLDSMLASAEKGTKVAQVCFSMFCCVLAFLFCTEVFDWPKSSAMTVSAFVGNGLRPAFLRCFHLLSHPSSFSRSSMPL
jgi:hypothetical protein